MQLTMSEAIKQALTDALDRGEPMALLGQDIGPHGGVFGVTRGLWERYGEEVIRDGPLCESSTVGFGIGLAISGVRAVVELEVMDFVGIAMDQVFNQAAKLHYFTGGKLSVPLVIRAAIGARVGMGPQHSQSLEAWFMHIPGLKVAMPSNAPDAYGLLTTALADSNPVLFLEPARLYGRRSEVDLEAPPTPFGQAAVAREGRDVTVVARGGRAPRGERCRGRGHRSAHPGATRHRIDRRLTEEDHAPRDRPRCPQDRRRRRRNRHAVHGAGVRLSRRTS